MVLLRSIVFMLLLSLTVAVFGTAILVGSRFLPMRMMQLLGRRWSTTVLWLLKVICGLRHRIYGLEHLPAGAAVVLSKHQSAWETIAFRSILPPGQTWVLKRELLRIPVFGWALRCFDPIAIDRSAGRVAMRQLLLQGKQHLAAGNWVVIFPEGTRVAAGQRKRFGIGGAMLAEKSRALVVPIAHNAGVFWKRRGLRKWPGCIDVVIGEPIDSDGRSAQEINALAEAWINATVDSLPGKAGGAPNEIDRQAEGSAHA